MIKHRINPCSVIVAATMTLFATLATGAAVQAQTEGEALLKARCAACHQAKEDGGLSRINEIRKTPEAWDMTLVRMMIVHGVQITADERRALVKYLADTQGMAPAETQGWRYVLERRGNVMESPPDADLAVMCARCHSYARTALQRRDTEDWLKHVHFHLGQWPTIEYQALGRDRDWFQIAITDVAPKLGEMYPLNTSEWSEWQERDKADLSGAWRVVGHQPGKGGYQGTLTVTGSGDDQYKVSMDINYASGDKASGEGNAIVYTGYEWRAQLQLGDQSTLQVFMLSESGDDLSGRWFLEDSDSLGGDLTAVRMDTGTPRILAVVPEYVRTGETKEVAVHGVNLDGDVGLGDGVEVVSTVTRDPQTVVVQVKANADANVGTRTVKVGAATASESFTVYEQVDSARVEPAYAIARVGGADGPLPPVPAQFDAIAYSNGADGEPNTDDDVRIGVMPAKWSVENFSEVAAALKDTEFTGSMDAAGLFMPAGAGLNPERSYSTNNAGDLTVKASVTDGSSSVEGTAHLIVTVQRWNDPPIR